MKLKRERAFMAYIIDNDKIVATCLRGSAYKWYVVIMNDEDPIEVLPGFYDCVEDAFNNFLVNYKKKPQ